MAVTCYVTFGTKYAHETHPVDSRARPDGWFEFVAATYEEARAAACDYLMGDDGFGREVPLFAFDYPESPGDSPVTWYPRGCLARFIVSREGRLEGVL